MTETQKQFIDDFNEAIGSRCVHRYLTRDSGLQITACMELEEMLAMLAEEKAKAIADSDERFANVLLGCESLTKASIAEIKMWLLLKEDKPDAAWSQLITAQDEFANALRADPGFAEADKQRERLHKVEALVFPPQTFFSAGMLVRDEVCSICERDYESCEHVKGRPYMGRFCTVRLINVEIDHVAIVDKPASKHCRALTMGVEGGKRNFMTLLVEPDGSEPENAEANVESGGMKIEAAIATTSTFFDGYL